MSGLGQIQRNRNNTAAIMGVMPWKILFVKNYFCSGGDVRHGRAYLEHGGGGCSCT